MPMRGLNIVISWYMNKYYINDFKESPEFRWNVLRYLPATPEAASVETVLDSLPMGSTSNA